MSELAKRPSLTSGVYYKDPKAAIAWLEEALGFESLMVVINDDGSVGHSELRFGDGMIFVGEEWTETARSPASMGGRNSQSIHLQVESGLDALIERARKAGAVVVREPKDEFYGERSAMITDPEGHMWTFGQTIRTMTFDEMAKAGGHQDIRERL